MDSDHAGDTTDRKSMAGYMVKLGEAIVMWGSRKQSTVSLSTCEAEYYAMTPASQEIISISRVVKDIDVGSNYVGVPKRSDNQAAIRWAVSECLRKDHLVVPNTLMFRCTLSERW